MPNPKARKMTSSTGPIRRSIKVVLSTVASNKVTATKKRTIVRPMVGTISCHKAGRTPNMLKIMTTAMSRIKKETPTNSYMERTGRRQPAGKCCQPQRRGVLRLARA
jgi:hypothetical protein